MRRILVLAVAAGVLAAPASAPAPAHADRPDRSYSQFVKEHTRVAMRDGVELSVDVWRPVTPPKVRVPVILTLSPYHSLYYGLDSNEADLPTLGDANRFVKQGYAFAQADVRGTWGSGGCWDYGGLHERQDGYDLVEWLGTRAWSNGRVAMTGASYDGTTANAAAIEQPPHLATIVPISAISRWWAYAYQQGARSSYSGESADIDPPSDTPTDFMFVYGNAPPPSPETATSAQQLAMRWTLCDRVAQTLHGYSTQPDYDAFWKERDYLQFAAKVKVPVLISHGLLDFNVKTWEGSAWYEALARRRDRTTFLVMGQWPHASPRGRYPEWGELLEKWYARWLYGDRNGVERESPVRLQANDKEWRLGRWKARATTRTYRLSGGIFAYADDGMLTESEMLRGTGGLGTRYVRVKLPTPPKLHIQGRPVLRLVASSDSPSTHFVAVLCAVGENGTCNVISRAFLNARYAFGLTKGQDLTPGKAYTFPLEFIDKDYIVPEGQHLEVIIASTSNTWVFPDERRARNTIDLDKSTLLVPTVR